MLDGIYLLITAIVVAGLSWALLHYLGEDAWPIIGTVMLFASTREIIALQRENKRLKAENEQLRAGKNTTN